MKNISVITTTRADYGILQPLIRRINNDPELELQLVVSGTHLSEQHGMTITEIESDDFPIFTKIPILAEGNAPQDISATMANALSRFGDHLAKHAPDMAVVLGDRSEMAAICAALINARVPIAHLQGGETTEGAIDECYRHCITKMAYLHFAANARYAKRIMQLGEAPERIFDVGALGVENAMRMDFVSPNQLADLIGLDVVNRERYAVVTFHPVTLERDTAEQQSIQLIRAMDAFPDMGFLCTMANADSGGSIVNAMLKSYAQTHSNSVLVASLGMRRYLNALRYAAIALGNSSSGIIEAPAVGTPTVNIGDRQRGRMQADSIVNCSPDASSIVQAMSKAMSAPFRECARFTRNPYGAGNTSELICETIKNTLTKGAIDLKKPFYDMP